MTPDRAAPATVADTAEALLNRALDRSRDAILALEIFQEAADEACFARRIAEAPTLEALGLLYVARAHEWSDHLAQAVRQRRYEIVNSGNPF